MQNEEQGQIISLQRLSRQITVVSHYVTHKELWPVSGVTWQPPEFGSTKQTMRGALKELFHDPLLRLLLPGEILLLPLLIMLVIFEALYPTLYLLLPSIFQAAVPLRKLTGGLLVYILAILPLVSALAVYILFGLRLVRRRQSVGVKALQLVLVVAAVLLWLTAGAHRVWDGALSEVPAELGVLNYEQVTRTLMAIWHSPGYTAISLILFYLPLIVVLAIWLSGPLYLVLMVLRWAIVVQNMQSPRELSRFLQVKLPLSGPEWNESLIELDVQTLNGLLAWAEGRTQVIQNKLIPTTLALAILAILADGPIGGAILPQIGAWISALFDLSSLGPANSFVALLGPSLKLSLSMIGLAIIIEFPLILVAFLLNESFAMDFIRQACILAQHAKPVGQRS